MGKEKTFKKLEEFKKKIQFNEKLGLDDRDNTILSLIQKNPNISQEEIAKKIKLSQPSVGARIKKLHQNGILQTVNGVNFRVVDLRKKVKPFTFVESDKKAKYVLEISKGNFDFKLRDKIKTKDLYI